MSMSTGTGTAREPALISFLTRFLTRFLEDHFYVRSSARPEPCRDRPHRREEWTHRYEMMDSAMASWEEASEATMPSTTGPISTSMSS